MNKTSRLSRAINLLSILLKLIALLMVMVMEMCWKSKKNPNLNTTDLKLGHQSENLSWNSVNIFSNFSFIKDHVLRIG